jgi:hypothetical protein
MSPYKGLQASEYRTVQVWNIDVDHATDRTLNNHKHRRGRQVRRGRAQGQTRAEPRDPSPMRKYGVNIVYWSEQQ